MRAGVLLGMRGPASPPSRNLEILRSNGTDASEVRKKVAQSQNKIMAGGKYETMRIIDVLN